MKNSATLVLTVFLLALAGNATVGASTIHAVLKDGLFYTPEGNAKLNLGPNNELIVERLGDSGQDGFRVLIGEAQGWSARFVPFAISNNSVMSSRIIGIDNQVVAEDRIEFVNGRLLGVANRHYGGSNSARRTYFEVRDEQLRLLDRRAVGLGEFIDLSAYLPPCGLANPPYHYERVVREDLSWWRICWPNCPGAPAGIVERTYCFVTTLPDPPPPQVRAVSVIAQRAGTLSMQTTSMRLLGHDHTGLGLSTMTASNGMLMVGNIGPSGADGVEVRAENGNLLRARWDELDPNGGAPAGAWLRLSAEGIVQENSAAQPLGSLRVQKNNQGRYELTTDFSALNSPTQLIEVYRHGEMVTSFQASDGLVATASRLPIAGSVRSRLPDLGPWCLWLDWPFAVDISSPRLANVVRGTQIRITPLGVAGLLKRAEKLRLVAQGLGEIPILAEWSERNGLAFAGNDHFPIGQSTLALKEDADAPRGTTLEVANLSANARDGVELDLGDAESAGVLLGPFRTLELPTGAALALEYWGMRESVLGQMVAGVTIRDNDDAAEFYLEIPNVPLPESEVLVYSGEQLIAQWQRRIGSNLLAQAAAPLPPPLWVIPGHLFDLAKWHFELACLRAGCWQLWITPRPRTPFPITLPDGQRVEGDRIAVRLSESLARSLGAIDRLFIKGSGMTSFQVLDEDLRVFGRPHRALGGAELLAERDRLTVANLGVTGEDGVAIELGRAQEVQIRLLDRILRVFGDPDPQPNIRLDLHGSAGGILGRHLGWVMGDPSPDPIIRVDFSPLGSSMHVVEVYRQGQLVERVAGNNGFVAEVSEWPPVMGAQAGEALSFMMNWPKVVNVRPEGHASGLAADELRISPAGPNLAQVDFLEKASLRTVGLAEFIMVQEQFRPLVRIGAIQLGAGQANLTVPTELGLQYTLEFRPSFGPQTLWQPVASIQGDGGSRILTHRPGPQPSQGFYRLRIE